MGIINKIYTYWSTDICSLARKVYAFKPRKMPTDINGYRNTEFDTMENRRSPWK